MDALFSFHMDSSGSAAAGIAWLYLVTQSVRIVTYLPQIAAVWRCRDGAHAISLLAWYAWMASHLASIAYGVLVIHDALFVAIAAINGAGCAAVAALATHRRSRYEKCSPLFEPAIDMRRTARTNRALEPVLALARCRCTLAPDDTVASPSCATVGSTPRRRRTDLRPRTNEEPAVIGRASEHIPRSADTRPRGANDGPFEFAAR